MGGGYFRNTDATLFVNRAVELLFIDVLALQTGCFGLYWSATARVEERAAPAENAICQQPLHRPSRCLAENFPGNKRIFRLV